MSVIQSIILGFVQGATEFLPVSSSGHLAILKYIFGISDGGITFDIMLHLATLVAVVAVYYKDIWQLIKNIFQIIGCIFYNLFNFFRRLGKSEDIKDELPYKEIISTPYRRFVVLAVISTIPVGVAGFLLEDYIGAVSAGILVPGICLLITGVVLLIAELAPGGHKSMKNMSFKSALGIGIAQACAIFPGISRSGSTISASLIAGLDKNFAVKYSFILSIPAILGAALKAIWDIVKGDVAIDSGMLGTYAIGMLVAMVVGYLAIRLLLVVVKKRKFRYFSIYCFAVGIFAIVGHFVI